MQLLQKQFHDFIHSNHLIEKEEKVLLAVSGGLDSMVMAHLFAQENIEVAIAHCNFGLRGKASDLDEGLVMQWADRKGLSCYVKSFDLKGSSIQLGARNARYAWFRALSKEHGFDKIATAHHLSDSLETSLINLVRGTGPNGIKGISVRNGKIIRPLLFAEKRHLHDYAMEMGLEWREDASNQHVDYDRNRIRLEVLPQLQLINPSLLKTFSHTAERLNFAAAIVGQRVKMVRESYLKEETSGWSLSLDWMNEPSDQLILAEVLSEFGINYPTSKEIYASRSQSGKSFPSEEWFITTDRNALYIDPVGDSKRTNVKIEKEGSLSGFGGIFSVEKVNRQAMNFDSKLKAYLATELIDWPLVIRTWKAGDKIQPLGMRGRKKVSDLLIDAKIPMSKKKDVLVVEINEEIAWVIGLQISEKFKVSEATEAITKLEFTPQEFL